MYLCSPLSQGITLASAKAVSAGNSCRQADVTACANLGRKAVAELLLTCKASSIKAEKDDERERSVGQVMMGITNWNRWAIIGV